eukprot:9502547-Pyramimonas_sp.AAC.1
MRRSSSQSTSGAPWGLMVDQCRGIFFGILCSLSNATCSPVILIGLGCHPAPEERSTGDSWKRPFAAFVTDSFAELTMAMTPSSFLTGPWSELSGAMPLRGLASRVPRVSLLGNLYESPLPWSA